VFFEQTTWKNWFTQFMAVTRQLRAENTRLVVEHVEWLKKMQELHEDKEMAKALARKTQKELVDALETSSMYEQKYTNAELERKLLAEGVMTQPGDIKAISLVKVQEAKGDLPETYSACVFTLDNKGTKVIKRELGADVPLNYALDNVKIAVMQAFDPEPLN
jgi:hypothetical protein